MKILDLSNQNLIEGETYRYNKVPSENGDGHRGLRALLYE